MIKKINISILLLLLSVGALSAAYISQFMFGLEPCIFCLYQRIPYFVIIILSIISLLIKGRIRKIFILLCGLSLILGAAIAFYHVGIEQGYIVMSDACDSEEIPSTIEEMTMQILGKTSVPCNEPQFVFLGVSMAGWNLVFSLIAGITTIGWFFRSFKK